uniref:DDE Tnp4 domain-containing protein n=1 Tax=Brassica oleracea var. oleracea TaxID=109376 RepID=A0A0D3BP81_BRAOL
MASSSNHISDESFDLDESFDEMFDKYFDQTFEQTFENLCNVYGDQQDQRKKKKKRVFMERNREEDHLRLWNDYFSDTPTYPANLFRRRFRMNKPLFMYIVDRLSNEVQFFRQKKDVTGRQGLSPLQKCTAAIRVLAYGSALDAISSKARSPHVNFSVNGNPYSLAYYLTDGIYPKWATFIQSIQLLQGPKAALFAQCQEAVRKDVERAFGVLQARFAIVKNPALCWDKVKIGKIMRACIILHNMIVENERDQHTQFDLSSFQQGEDSGSSHVDLTYSTDIPTNIANQMGVRTRICDKQAHQQWKRDLVEHIWRKFERDQDNN